MLPSSTVENYLKAIYQGSQTLPAGQRLMPMGQLASALGIAPGTATTMVKTLSESGLAEYEPYSGVTLTPAGERLAALVLRRHRLVELFLVRFMGLGWDEVHDEAEHLEHVVSDRLIARMDEMLGRPEVDPHGDPIPDEDGAIKRQDLQDLLSCPLNAPLTVARVVDQDRAFLQFIENHHLKPGESIEVEHRDAASDSVRVKGQDDRRLTIGTRAASKILVRVLGALALLAASSWPASAQTTAPAQTQPRVFEILDNSFLVEEAFNQEAGVLQTIFGLQFTPGGPWETTLTQEWPLPGQRHQLSYTLPLGLLNGRFGLGDVMVHYRLQATTEGAGRAACAPRISLIVPSGNAALGFGDGHVGWQLSVPVSKQVRDLQFHGNAGITRQGSRGAATQGVVTPQIGGSVIWRTRSMLHLMLEGLAEWAPRAPEDGGRESTLTLSPGLRTGWNRGDTQWVTGLAAPVTRMAARASVGAFLYLSYERPFLAPGH